MSGDVSTLYHEEIVFLQMCILPKDVLRTNVPHNATWWAEELHWWFNSSFIVMVVTLWCWVEWKLKKLSSYHEPTVAHDCEKELLAELKMTIEAPEVRSDKRNPNWTLFKHQTASISIYQHQSALIRINQHQSESISIDQHQSRSVSNNQQVNQHQSTSVIDLQTIYNAIYRHKCSKFLRSMRRL